MNNFNRELITFLSTLIEKLENDTISEEEYVKILEIYLDKYDNDIKYFIMGYYVYSMLKIKE